MSNITPEKYRRRVAYTLSDELITEQSHKDECDINTILKRYLQTGYINHAKQHAGTYVDFSGICDFQGTMEKINLAREVFESVPSGIRKQFDNDPGKYLDFMMDVRNRETIEQLGLPTDHFPATKQPQAELVPLPATPAGGSLTINPTEPV